MCGDMLDLSVEASVSPTGEQSGAPQSQQEQLNQPTLHGPWNQAQRFLACCGSQLRCQIHHVSFLFEEHLISAASPELLALCVAVYFGRRFMLIGSSDPKWSI